MAKYWSAYEIDFLKKHYPQKGKMWCAEKLGRTEAQIRWKASDLKLKQDLESDFRKDWQRRAARSKIGKKRPQQSVVMKQLHKDGKLLKTKQQCKDISERVKKQWKTIPHPKGMQGKKHSAETKCKISEASLKTWANMSEKEKDKRAKQASINARTANIIGNRAKASWKAGWREIGDKRKYFRSRWEANYARYLEFLKKQGQILEWEHEPETFWFNGIKRGCMSYLPDFRVTENSGKIIYHEVKGWMDDRSKTKIKRMAKYHPNIILIVIDKKGYNAIKKQMQHIIKEWE